MAIIRLIQLKKRGGLSHTLHKDHGVIWKIYNIKHNWIMKDNLHMRKEILRLVVKEYILILQ